MAFDTSNPIIHRKGSAAVIYDLSRPESTTITLPSGSQWTSGLHWHERHDEYLRVMKGTIKVTLGSHTVICRPGEEVHVKRFERHEWQRADIQGGDDVIVEERTDPADDEKHLFFWNLNGVILASKDGFLTGLLITLRLFLIFYEMDNFPVMASFALVRKVFGRGAADAADYLLTHIVLASTSILARLLGFRAIDTALTPAVLIPPRRQPYSVKSR